MTIKRPQALTPTYVESAFPSLLCVRTVGGSWSLGGGMQTPHRKTWTGNQTQVTKADANEFDPVISEYFRATDPNLRDYVSIRL